MPTRTAGRQGRPQGRLQAPHLESSTVGGFAFPLDERTVCPQDHHCRLYAPCRALYHPALTKRDDMQFDDHPAPPPPTPRGPSRAAWVAATVVALLVVTAVVAVLMTRGDGEAAGSTAPEPSSSQTTASPTTTTIDTRTEVVARLREILRVRDRALETRNASLLSSIYTVDCPCFQGDRDAIRRLKQSHEVWRGVATSISVQNLEKVNERLWIVNALFVAAPFQVENESGDLIRNTPGERNLTRFALARPAGHEKWLLGYVSLIERRG